jgi:hypothetical protein
MVGKVEVYRLDIHVVHVDAMVHEEVFVLGVEEKFPDLVYSFFHHLHLHLHVVFFCLPSTKKQIFFYQAVFLNTVENLSNTFQMNPINVKVGTSLALYSENGIFFRGKLETVKNGYAEMVKYDKSGTKHDGLKYMNKSGVWENCSELFVESNEPMKKNKRGMTKKEINETILALEKIKTKPLVKGLIAELKTHNNEEVDFVTL